MGEKYLISNLQKQVLSVQRRKLSQSRFLIVFLGRQNQNCFRRVVTSLHILKTNKALERHKIQRSQKFSRFILKFGKI